VHSYLTDAVPSIAGHRVALKKPYRDAGNQLVIGALDTTPSASLGHRDTDEIIRTAVAIFLPVIEWRPSLDTAFGRSANGRGIEMPAISW
jgi:hypothetical protein